MAKTYVSNSSLFDLPDDLATPDFFRLLPYFKESLNFAHARDYGRIIKPSLRVDPTETIMAWVNNQASQVGAMKRYEAFQKSSKHPADMDDIRIRDVSDAQSFTLYLQAGEAVSQFSEAAQVRGFSKVSLRGF